MLRTRYFLLITIVLFLSVTGCSRLGVGVILWPPEDGEWQAGELVSVLDESRLRSSYIVADLETREKGELDIWRLRLFKKPKEAQAWVQGYKEWASTYALSTRQGLPLRSDPSSTASQVYKLREGEVLKVLGRGEEKVLVGGALEGYWYRLLTENGVEAYGFDYYLRVYQQEGANQIFLNEEEVLDPLLDNFLSGTWRPEYYASMVSRRKINLGTFREEYGLFPDPVTRTLTLRTKEHTVVETWEEIVSLGRSRYDFVGSSFRVTLPPSGFASVQYLAQGKEVSEAYIRLEEEVSVLIEKEVLRRQEALAEFTDKGPLYTSRSYGTLSFDEAGGFTWSGKSSLISRGVVSPDAGSAGTVRFNHFLSSAIASRHRGVLTLHFEGGQVLSFLYRFEQEALRLLYVPSREINQQVVLSDQFIDPIRIFFVPEAKEEAGELLLPDRG